MKAIFLSDAHIRKKNDKNYNSLVSFLGKLKHLDSRDAWHPPREQSDAGSILLDNLFILGDFFDFWFCKKDNIYPVFTPIIEQLIRLKKEGVHIHFCEGNHDFFLSDYFTQVLGMEVFEEWAEFVSNGRRFLLSHGDTVDQENSSQILLRRFLRSKFFYLLQKWLPSSLIWETARISSSISRHMSNGQEDILADKMLAFAMIKFQEGYDVIILGHSHKPMLKNNIIVNNRQKIFATLGDWLNHSSYLSYDNGRFELVFYEQNT
jgi:UDP-2,3-diacylglucosamine hydrolase